MYQRENMVVVVGRLFIFTRVKLLHRGLTCRTPDDGESEFKYPATGISACWSGLFLLTWDGRTISE